MNFKKLHKNLVKKLSKEEKLKMFKVSNMAKHFPKKNKVIVLSKIELEIMQLRKAHK